MKEYAIIILAAGSSTRLGYPKQLLPYNDTSILFHLASEAFVAIPDVLVVLGSNADIIKEEVKNLPVNLLYNKDWEDGMSSSIRCGLSHLLKTKSPDAVIIMVSDQPFVTASLLNKMIKKYEESKKPIIACSYKNTLGVPVLFDKDFFGGLKEIEGQSGAKKIINTNMDLIEAVSFPLGNIDIDTAEDYEAFRKIFLSN